MEVVEEERLPTIQNGRKPMDDCCPEVNPAHKRQIVWCIGLFADDIIDRLVKNCDWS
jgi:hypothetical protein